MFNRIRGKRTELTFAEDLQNKLSDAMYKTSRKNSVDLGTDYKYVKVSRQVITGDNPEQWATDVYNYINEEIRKGKDVQVIADTGEVLTITEDTAGKARFRNYVQEKDNIKRLMSDDEYALKLRAETHVDELAQISKKKGWREDKKNHPFAKDGFDYRVAYFEDFDGEYYRVVLSVGKNGEIATVYNVSNLKEAQSPSGSKAGQATPAGGASASNSSIAQNDPTVKQGNDGKKQLFIPTATDEATDGEEWRTGDLNMGAV